MRYTLGIDTASPEGSVALAEDGRAVAVERLLPREHSSGLSLAAERLLASRSLGLGDLAGVAVAAGPGSFTGLRIGLAWAKGVALGRGIRLALVSSHEAGAHADRGAFAWVATVLPSERGFVEVALWNGGAPAPAWGPERVEREDAVPVLVEQAERRGRERDPGAAGSRVEIRPVAGVVDAPFEEDASDAGFSIRTPGPLAAAVAEIGDRMLESGAHADPILAAPAYGREPNARKPAP